MKVWKLKKDHDRRIRQFHPWVFSNELAESPRGIKPGDPIELQDFKGAFLAYGYGNPNSLIAFRALSFDSATFDFGSAEALAEKLIQAWKIRRGLGYRNSFRLCYSEVDQIPGLVVDYYLVQKEGKISQVFAVQILTAGMQALLPEPQEIIRRVAERAIAEGLSELSYEQTAVVLRNDVNIRKLENMDYQEPKILKAIEGLELNSVEIRIEESVGSAEILMSADLYEGQKTGFFLDQTHNIRLVVQQLEKWIQSHKSELVKRDFIRVLDLCCYVGHWSSQISHLFAKHGLKIECTQVDVSEQALNFAKKNGERQGALVITQKMDVLEGLHHLPSKSFDVVIADPPAFIKAKKDVPTGKHAYLKLNTQAFRLVRSGGFVVSCSCSGLLEEEDFREALKKAATRNAVKPYLLMRGGPSSDHPSSLYFPEGGYLKMFLHYVM